jgi:hypothetical protein
VASPLADLVDPALTATVEPVDTPHALDLPQVTDPAAKPAKPTRADNPWARPTTAGLVPAPAAVSVASSTDGEDVTDWI